MLINCKGPTWECKSSGSHSNSGMVRGKLALIIIGQRPTELIVDAGMGYLGIFTRLSSLFLSLVLSGRRPDIHRNTVSKGR